MVEERRLGAYMAPCVGIETNPTAGDHEFLLQMNPGLISQGMAQKVVMDAADALKRAGCLDNPDGATRVKLWLELLPRPEKDFASRRAEF